MYKKCIDDLNTGKYHEAFKAVYPIGSEQQPQRFIGLTEGFRAKFGELSGEIRLFSSPGRTEIGGNHTDHQQGRVLAAAVQMDVAAVVVATDQNVIKISSEGFGLEAVDITDLGKREYEINTTAAVIRGVCARLVEQGYRIGGFYAYCNSSVPVGSGLSSSASFENLVTTILNCLYNDGKITPIVTAQIGQFAENVYFGKPSGLMDQAASAIGGVISIDFEDKAHPKVQQLSLDLSQYDYSLCVVNTGGDHADLTNDYAAIFIENKQVANYFKKEVLREVPEELFYAEIPRIRKLFGDRAVVRAMHFFDDNARVLAQVEALEKKNFEHFKELVIASGESSFNRLQNIYSNKDPKNQPISLALEYSRELLSKMGGAWRIHGGGFAGTIQAYVPNSYVGDYAKEMNRVFGENATQLLAIRGIGSCEISL